MSTSGFHCLGRGHEARFSEDFDQLLAEALRAAPDPEEAAEEIDDTTLLTVLANFAGAGPYEPAQGSSPPGRLSFLRVDEADPAIRHFHWDWWRDGIPGGRFGFTGRTLAMSQTVVFWAWFQPIRR